MGTPSSGHSRSTLVALVFSGLLVAAALIPSGGGALPNAVPFLGRFHPLALHLPIGILAAVLVLELIGWWNRSATVRAAANTLVRAAAVSAWVAAALGLMLARSGDYGPELLGKHLWSGIATAVFALWLVVLQPKPDASPAARFRPAYHGTLLLSVIAMSVAGHYGGSLTHGSDYLTAHMPAGLKSMLGIGGPGGAVAAGNPAERPVYASVIQPVLQDKCVNCHGADKQEHKLRLDSYAATIAGGKSGSNVVAGSSQSSLMIQSVHLPLNDKKHMPPEGKSQLTPDEVALLAWWIDQGAPDAQPVGRMKISRPIARVLKERIGLPSLMEEVPMMPIDQALPRAQEIATAIGIEIMPLSATNAGLQLSALPGGKSLTDADLMKLAPIGNNLVRLSLPGCPVTDAGLDVIAKMPNLEMLDLSRTAITDAGLAKLLPLQRLQHLVLHSTAITDTGLVRLAELGSLRKVFLWQTQVTTSGVERLESAFVDEGQRQEWQQQVKELQAKISAMGIQANAGVTPPATTTNVTATTATASTAKPINEKCCYTGKPVNPAITSIYKGIVVGFCCEKCKGTFDKNPDAEAKKNPLLAGK